MQVNSQFMCQVIPQFPGLYWNSGKIIMETNEKLNLMQHMKRNTNAQI